MAKIPDSPGDYLFRRVRITEAGGDGVGNAYAIDDRGTILRGTSLPALFVVRLDNGKHPYVFCNEFELIDEGDGDGH